MMTVYEIDVPAEMVSQYLESLVGRFYKILPLKEDGEPSLVKYMESLQREMLGCTWIFPEIKYDELFLSLISTLQYLINIDCEVEIVKCEVFKAIGICKKLNKKYCSREVSG